MIQELFYHLSKLASTLQPRTEVACAILWKTPFLSHHLRELCSKVFEWCLVSSVCPFYAPPQKVAGYYVIPSELLSVCPSVCPSVRPYVRLSVRPSVRQRLNIRVRSITLIPFKIISPNLAQI